MTNQCRSSNDENVQPRIYYYFGLRHLIIPSTLVIRASSLFSLVNDKLVSVGIAKLCHPANRRVGLFNIERDSPFFQLRDGRVNVIDFETNRCPVTRRFPRGMTTNSDRGRAKIILDPCAVHLSRTGL